VSECCQLLGDPHQRPERVIAGLAEELERAEADDDEHGDGVHGVLLLAGPGVIRGSSRYSVGAV
jgi:hypothetical protein